MPVILPADAFDMWLDCGNVDALTAAELCVSPRDGTLEAHEVSPAVNHADNDGPALIEPAPPPPPGAERDEAAPAKSARKKDDRQFSLF